MTNCQSSFGDRRIAVLDRRDPNGARMVGHIGNPELARQIARHLHGSTLDASELARDYAQRPDGLLIDRRLIQLRVKSSEVV